MQIRRERTRLPVHVALRVGLCSKIEMIEKVRTHYRTVCDVDHTGCTAYMVAAREQSDASISEEILKQALLLHKEQSSSPFSLAISSILSELQLRRFRVPLQVASAKVYFEVSVNSANTYAVGFASSLWNPRSNEDAIVIHGGKLWCCRQYFEIPGRPKWNAGTAVGASIDLTQSPAVIQFFIDGVPLRMSHLGLPMLFQQKSQVVAIFAAAAGGEMTVNFGEAPPRHEPPQGFSFPRESAGDKFHRIIEVLTVDSTAWEPLKMQDGYLAQSWDDWSYAVSQKGNADLIDAVLSRHITQVEALCHLEDSSGRRAIDVASSPCRMVMHRYLHFLGRYEVVSKDFYRSGTSMVYLARDLHTGDMVALKLMKSVVSFKRELESREKLKLESARLECSLQLSLQCSLQPSVQLTSQLSLQPSQQPTAPPCSPPSTQRPGGQQSAQPTEATPFVINVIRSFNGEEDEEFRDEVQRKGFGDYNYCIVMPAAQRNLHEILGQENIAGKDWTAIRRITEDILNCLAHLHNHSLIHGDVKPLNIMRTSAGKMVLIDLDVSRQFETTQVTTRKFSSAFCPPEAVEVDSVTSNVSVVFSNHPTGAASAGAEGGSAALGVLSQPTFDMWALGVTLYEMFSGGPLFRYDHSNMLDIAELIQLHDRDDTIKAEKLGKITDAKARNMLSRLLCKDPRKRMSTATAQVHPFVSGKGPARMVGDAPYYDVFISYRQASDKEYAQKLYYEKLVTEGKTVFWDNQSLPDGKPWEEGFCDGLVQSRVFVCLISKDAVGHPTSPRQCFSRLAETSDCDNVLLEHQLALELQGIGGLIESIFPVFIGEKQLDGTHAAFDWGCYGALPDVVVSSVIGKVAEHLDRLALGVPLAPARTVKQVKELINKFNGYKIEGDGDVAFETVKRKVLKLCGNNSTLNARSNLGGAPAERPEDILRAEKQQLTVELQTQREQREAEKQQLETLLQAEREQKEAEKRHLEALLQAEREQREAEKQRMQDDIAALMARLNLG